MGFEYLNELDFIKVSTNELNNDIKEYVHNQGYRYIKGSLKEINNARLDLFNTTYTNYNIFKAISDNENHIIIIDY
ncbi:hypothetical protein AABD41_01485 [Staphylococcus pseudoxylosus]|uniref:hypothetical protein n=1 Tax=Staphylococcus pseudoxylosus TaxID=2282419 RepID=UPI00398B257F